MDYLIKQHLPFVLLHLLLISFTGLTADLTVFSLQDDLSLEHLEPALRPVTESVLESLRPVTPGEAFEEAFGELDAAMLQLVPRKYLKHDKNKIVGVYEAVPG